MPVIKLEIIIEKDLEESSYKHFLNHENFDVYSTKEVDTMFTMVAKKPQRASSIKSEK